MLMASPPPAVPALEAERVVQVDEREQPPPIAADQRPLDIDHARGARVVPEPDQLDEVDLGDRESVPAGPDDQGVDDRQGEGDRQLDRRPPARRAHGLDAAADRLDAALDDVHADAPARDHRRRVGRREPRPEDQADQLALRPAGRLVLGEPALLDGLAADRLRIDPLAVVRELDVDHSPFVERPEPELPLGRLPCALADLGRLDPVIHRVADDVRQRVLDRLGQRLVQLGLLALHRYRRPLAAGQGQVADDPRELRGQRPDRLHPRLHHLLLQLGRDRVEPLGRDLERRLVVAQVAAEELVPRQDELADQVHQRIEQPDVDPDRRLAQPRTLRRSSDGRGRRRRRWSGDRLLDRGLSPRLPRLLRGLCRRGRSLGLLRDLMRRRDFPRGEFFQDLRLGVIRDDRISPTQGREPSDQRRVVAVALPLARLDRAEDAPHGIDEREETARDFRRRPDLSLPQPAE